MQKYIESKEKDEEMSRLAVMVEICVEKLLKSKLPRQGRIYALGNFEVELAPSLTGDILFDFWRKGQKERLWARFNAGANSLVLFEEGKAARRMAFDFYPDQIISEHIRFRSGYPNFEFRWTGKEKEDLSKGTLTFLRIDISGKHFVNYHYQMKGNYEAENRSDRTLAKLGFPEDLVGVREILDQPIMTKIDFEARKKDILEKSALEKVIVEIYNRT